ncbi:sulfite exporter TauE/SafE family protein [Mesorhizobium sp. WSM4906]|uniref:sulfite exporter TauE/SafE family protein n=1 Tax=Mesorhizobium sp. WSM4906 TaxID=3038546 RepID=UPI002417A205|nr:sulfite exporter TauE/SafE family protein [Mesorhizobium sp. WSM4906]WFP76804.1 sulfite exporter TauE/SafE family protein [Mesorhizobium sp. WSM4906]
MGLGSLAAFAGFAAIAAYVQTLTGFAFGLIMMGAIALVGLLPLPDAAAMVGMLTLVNAAQMLIQGGWREVARRELRMILVASLPSLFVGYVLLEWLADTRADLLKIGLGLVIMLSSLQLAVRPAGLAKPSSNASFVGFGVISGLMSGLFATSGPPLVYLLFRQPLPHVRIRETLVTAFGAAQAVRLGTVVASGNLPAMSPMALVLAVPAVMLATYAARRWPPSLSQRTMRRSVFVLLFLSGLSLALPAIMHLAV